MARAGNGQGLCEWFLLCTNDAEVRIPHPAFPKGVPACGRCAARSE